MPGDADGASWKLLLAPVRVGKLASEGTAEIQQGFLSSSLISGFFCGCLGAAGDAPAGLHVAKGKPQALLRHVAPAATLELVTTLQGLYLDANVSLSPFILTKITQRFHLPVPTEQSCRWSR